MSAGRAWAQGTLFGGQQETADDAFSDAAYWGFELDESALATDSDGVWAENVPAVMAFLTVQTQWRVTASMEGLHYTGLDYAGAAAGLSAANIEVSPELWADIRLIEMGARTALQEART